MKNLLWVGDAGCPSGFALATHKILDALSQSYNVTVLGINYRGDPHAHLYPIYAAAAGGDAFGVGRLIWMCDQAKPDIIVVQNDPWNIPLYMHTLRSTNANYHGEYANVPVVGNIAVDGKNCTGRWLKDLACAVFWTKFAEGEAKAGGYAGQSAVIPLGVDLNVYKPIEQLEARMRRLPKQLDEAFIVGNVNRNQPRKRWDLTVRYFAEWVKRKNIGDAYLYLHTAPTGDAGVDVKQLARYYGVADRLCLMEPEVFYGIPEEQMCDTYNCFDVQVSTTQGEGFGLTTFEGMACGIPQIVPDWSALGELLSGAAQLVQCTATAVGPPYVNVVGGVADEVQFIEALDRLYCAKAFREKYSELGLKRVREAQFRWESVGAAWKDLLDRVVSGKPVAQVEAIA